ALGRRHADGQVQLARGQLRDRDVRRLDPEVDLLDLGILPLPVVLLRREPGAGCGDRRGDVVRTRSGGLACDAEAEVARLRLRGGETVEDVLRPDVVHSTSEPTQEG